MTYGVGRRSGGVATTLTPSVADPKRRRAVARHPRIPDTKTTKCSHFLTSCTNVHGPCTDVQGAVFYLEAAQTSASLSRVIDDA